MIQELKIKTGLATSASQSVSNRYKFISTKDIVQTLQKRDWNIVVQVESGIRKPRPSGFQKHMLIFENTNFVTAEGKIRIVIRNSHEGSSSLQVFVGFLRHVCKNQLFSKNLGNGLSYRIRHNENGLNQLDSAIQDIIINAHKINENIENLKEKILTPDQVIVFTTEAIRARFNNEDMIDNIDFEELHIPNRVEDSGNSAWVVFQRLQEQFTKGGLYYSDGKRLKKIRSLKSVNTLPEFNSKLWELANTV